MSGEDDDDLWHEVASTIKPLRGKKPVISTNPAKIKITARTTDKVITAPKTAPGPLPQKRIRKLKQQKIPVEAKLDLHGMTVEKAHQIVTGFLNKALQNELRCVEIVTGRGNLERGTGQLKRQLPLWLQDPALRMHILHIGENPASRGGSYLILLRRIKG